MAESKFEVPTENIDLPSKGLVYQKESPLSSGFLEMKYMTAREEDILTNVNLLRQGIAIEKMLISLIKTPVPYEDLTLGDRNALLISARILSYGKDYTFKYANPNTGEEETVTIDLQDLKYKELDWSIFENKNEFEFAIPNSKNVVTFKILTVADDKKIDEEIKGMKKATGVESGYMSTRLKHQLLSVNGDYSVKTVRDFVDSGALLAVHALSLRNYMKKITPDIDTVVRFTLKDGTEISTELPMGAEFFFPTSGV